MKIESMMKKVEKDISSLRNVVDEPIKRVIDFVKRHKKLIITLAVIYLVYNYLFLEEE